MIKPIVLLIGLSCIVGLDAIALTGADRTTCDFGELEKVDGLCTNAKTSPKCTDYCKNKLGGALIAAHCTHERPNKKRECICRAKCCTQSCWGDPHCTTCDGTKFGYQGLRKYYVMKPMAKFPTFPYFEIRQVNRVYKRGPMAYLGELELFIRDWGLTIFVDAPPINSNRSTILKINGQPQKLPYKYHKFEDNRELFATVGYNNPKQKQVIIKTSFGVRIIIGVRAKGLAIDIPRHPELKGKLGGVLGGWDGHPGNDGIGPHGKKHPLDIKFSWRFGNSWIVPGHKPVRKPKPGQKPKKKKPKKPKQNNPAGPKKPKKPKKPKQNGNKPAGQKPKKPKKPKKNGQKPGDGKRPKKPKQKQPQPANQNPQPTGPRPAVVPPKPAQPAQPKPVAPAQPQQPQHPKPVPQQPQPTGPKPAQPQPAGPEPADEDDSSEEDSSESSDESSGGSDESSGSSASDSSERLAEQQIKEFDEKADKIVKSEAEKLCNAVLSRPHLKQCVEELGRRLPLLGNCVMDLLFLESVQERKDYIEDVVDNIEETCRRRNKKKGRRSSSSSASGGTSSESGEGTNKPKKPKQPKPAVKPAPPKQKEEAVGLAV